MKAIKDNESLTKKSERCWVVKVDIEQELNKLDVLGLAHSLENSCLNTENQILQNDQQIIELRNKDKLLRNKLRGFQKKRASMRKLLPDVKKILTKKELKDWNKVMSDITKLNKGLEDVKKQARVQSKA